MSEDRSLHTMSEFYRRLIEYISDGLCVSTRGDGKILYANQAFLDILDIECDPPALVGRRLDEFIPAVHPGGLLADMPAPADTVRGKEFHFRTAKGNERSVIYDAFFAEWPGAEGRAVVLLLRDISEWRRTDDALRRSEEQFRSVFESMTDCILIWDRAYNYLYANRAAIEHVGTTPERVIGRNMRDGLGHIPEFMKLWMSRIDHVFATGKPLQVQDSVPVGDRLVRSESSISPIRDSKGDIFAVGVVYRDITESKKANEALKESENKYRGLFESSRDAIMTLEPPSWKFTSGNPATMEMFRARNAEEFTKQGPWVLSPERQPDGRASAEKALEMIETAMREGSHYFEWTHKRLDGEEFPATVLLTRMEQAGKVIVQATVRDITESKRAEEALRESEERYRIQFEQTIDALFLADTQTGIILECNRAAMELIGREKSEMVGQHQRILHPHEEWDERFSTSFKQHIAGKTLVETKVIKKSGEIRDVAIRASMFHLKGKKVILAIFRDITERKRAKSQREAVRAVRESERKYRLLIEQAPEAILLATPDGNLIEANRRARELLGRSRRAIGRMRIEQLHPSGEHERVAAAFGEIVRNGEGGVRDVQVVQRGGMVISVDIVGSVIEFGGKRVAQAIFRDISEEKRVQQMKDNIIRDISHELKAPIAMMRMAYTMGDEALRSGDAAAARKAQAIAAKNLETLRKDVNNILESYALRVASGGPSKSGVSMKKLIREIVADLEYPISEREIAIDVAIPAAADRIRIDRRAMRSLMYNLVDNAVKFTKRGRITVTARLTARWLWIRVKDTGCGIAAEVKRLVFSQFYKGDPSMQGTGLGLAICREIAATYGGSVRIHSRGKGKGTTVVVQMPRSLVTRARRARASS